MFERKDSPTVDNEGVWLICSFAASHYLVIHCGDLDHGYFQGELLTEKQLLVLPKNGIPEVVEPGARLCDRTDLWYQSSRKRIVEEDLKNIL